MLPRKIADSTVRRLAIYLRFLEEFQRQGKATISSEALASRAGTTSVVAVVDRDPERIGRSLGQVLIEDVARLEEVVARQRVEIAILATPADPAQGLVDRLIAAGVTAILNFAPVQLQVPEGVDVKNVNLAVELETLSYALSHREPR